MAGPARPLICCGTEREARAAPSPRVHVTPHGDVMVVRLLGRLDPADSIHARQRLLKCLADVPSVVLVDASGLWARPGMLESLLCDLARQNELWPRVRIVATGIRRPSSEPGRGIGCRPLLDIAPSVLDAFNWLRRPTARTRRRTPLAARTVSAPRARSLVRGQCQEWGAGHLAPPAELVATELVTNAVRHVGYGIRLAVETDGDCVAIEVRDPDPEPPRFLHSGVLAESGRGLDVLSSAVNTWGCLPTRPGGKVVWAAWALSEGYAQACARRNQEN